MEGKVAETAVKQLIDRIERICPADKTAMEQAKRRWNAVAKPIGSLGVLEEDVIRIAAMTGDAGRISLQKSALVVMCADHGVVKEGVTQTGQEVTKIVADNFAARKTSVTIMCETTKTDVFPVDIGMAAERPSETVLRPFTLLDRKISFGSGNIAVEPAMSQEQCAQAILCGMEIVSELKELGYEIIATGEMGIGNTTPSSALAAAFTGMNPKEATGRGAGLSNSGLARKQEVVAQAVNRCKAAIPEGDGELEDTLQIFSELGGFDLAGIAGLFLGGALCHIPVIIDGFISSVAALAAARLCPAAKDYMLASHVSAEPAGMRVMEELGLSAPLHCNMHLGEGSGAVALLPLLYMGADVYGRMSSFEEIQVETYVDYNEKEDCQ